MSLDDAPVSLHETGQVEDDEPGDTAAPSRVAGAVVAGVVIFVTVVLGLVLFHAMRPGDSLPPDPVGTAAPGFELPGLNGGSLGTDDLVGSPALVTFWASWCATCKDDMPLLNRVADEWAGRGVQVLGVVVNDDADKAAAVAVEQGLSYPSVVDDSGTVGGSYGVVGTPETFLLDADGDIVAKWAGSLPAPDLERALAAANEVR